VIQANDVLAGGVLTVHRVVIIGGGQVGAETADYWGILGRLVAMVEMLPEIAAGEVRR